jgi:Coatomer gamma subunit appendage platform subdomain
MPQFAALGTRFKSCKPAMLTEEGLEYVVTVVKHIFEKHVVLQFNCTNTFSEQVRPSLFPSAFLRLFFWTTWWFATHRLMAMTAAYRALVGSVMFPQAQSPGPAPCAAGQQVQPSHKAQLARRRLLRRQSALRGDTAGARLWAERQQRNPSSCSRRAAEATCACTCAMLLSHCRA